MLKCTYVIECKSTKLILKNLAQFQLSLLFRINFKLDSVRQAVYSVRVTNLTIGRLIF